MSRKTTESRAVDTLHALHGWALLAARDASGDQEREEYMAQAEAFEHAIIAVTDEWDPFNEQAREDYREVSEAVIQADRNNTEDSSDEPPTMGLE